MGWRIAIDVGGTFTDCLAWDPTGRLRTWKLLSSGVVRGRIAAAGGGAVLDPARRRDPAGFWAGAALAVLDATGGVAARRRVTASTPDGRLALDAPLGDDAAGRVYELATGDDAPVVGVRWLLGLAPGEPVPPVSVRLGTTRGTNALLTRTGARTALVTTRGFGDVLAIGNQDRPRLFELAVRKPAPLPERAVEVDERLAADGAVLVPLDDAGARRLLETLRDDGFEAVAICLLHAHVNPVHEERLVELAREAGIPWVSASSTVAPLEKIVARADTTVLDAYLTPVLHAYVRRLRAALGEGSRLQVMTSAGGLVDAERFSGKDSVLSGPAGGVVGVLRVAEGARALPAIGFDMGGTSTDVARTDGRLEVEFEGEKAGVRVVAPRLAIETVAAGGGSICAFDGVKLVVGPASAGAEPGPACYGRGGPLTVTDVNLVLGRLPAERFPFPIDAEAPRRRLRELSQEVARAGGPRWDEGTLAEGFLEVANARMVRAIRAVSIARGVDPRTHALVCYGGAGGQHACAVARALGIRRVLVPPLAGYLSAFGIGVADVRRFRERAAARPWDDEAAAALEPILDGLEASARADVLGDGVPADRIEPPVRWLSLRYVGVETSVAVRAPADGDWVAAYEREHERLFGYRHADRPVEVVAARVEVVGRGERLAGAGAPSGAGTAGAPARADVVFGGVARATPILAGDALAPGEEVVGPAIVLLDGSTVVVEPGWRARVGHGGELDLIDEAPVAASVAAGSTEADPVRLEIFHNHFAAIAERMGIVLRHTASSTNVKERLDFSCAVFTRAGDLVVNAPHIPVHLGAMSETVRALLADAPTLRRGDVLVTNDPYRGGSHLPDVTVVTPVFHETELAFFVASRAHHAEIGGVVPGSMPPASRSLAEEGVVIPPMKLVDGGVSRVAELERLLASAPYPSRRIADNLADVAAQAAANQAGVEGLAELVAREGLAVVTAYMDHIQRAAAAKMRRALVRLPSGTRRFVDHLDDGTPIAVAITIVGERATVDFTGTGPVVAGNLNANRAITTSAILYCFRLLIDEDVPLNAGVLEPLHVVIPPSCLLDPQRADDPARCPAVVGGNVETSQRIVDAILGALGVAAASQGTMNNLALGDDRFGYYETLCGGSGATRDADGADAVHTHMTNTRLTDTEVLERRVPVRVVRFAVRRGSGGAGARRGGDGVVRELELLAPVRVSLLTERRGPYAPYGVAGGAPGALGRNRLVRAAGGEVELPGKVTFDAAPGDRLVIETPGGGGWGTV